VRAQALTSLGLCFAVQKQRILPVLEKYRNDPDATVRKTAEERIEVLGTR